MYKCEADTHLNNIYEVSPYLKESNTSAIQRSVCKIIPVYTENHTMPVMQNAQLLIAEIDGIYS